MINIEQMSFVLDALPDPAFILSRTGKYVAVFGGRDKRYYHDGAVLVGQAISDSIQPDKANWFLEQIGLALASRQLLVVEYELSNKDVRGLTDEGPEQPIWFEGRIQALDFQADGEDVVLWVASNISARHDLEVRLRELSDTDQLTGLFNRRKLEHELTRQYDASVRYALPTSVLMFDLDNLKQINDTRGHHVGDELIQTVSEICRSQLRKTDSACRFGGDEFVVVLPNTEPQQAMLMARRVHDCLRDGFSRFSDGGVAVSASMGVTTIRSEDRSYEDTLKRADQALYAAKNAGKNRIVML